MNRESKGWAHAEARKSYQKCFDIFKDADPDLPLLLQGREEFAKLGS